MARAVLALCLLICPVIALAGDCAGKPETRALQQHLMGGPLYKALAKQAGKPLSCDVVVEESKTTLTYKFRTRLELRAVIDPAIEASEQRLMVRMTMARAKLLLQSAEQYEYKGCGIDWTHSAEKTTSADGKEVAYQGGTCNCQARIVLRDKHAVQLVIRSAC